MAEHSGSGTDGGDGDGTSEEETAQDREFIDNDEQKPDRRQRLPKLTAEEKVVSEDELENLKDTCLAICKDPPEKGKKKKKVYADPSDEEDATLSDEAFISSSSGEEDLRQTEAKAGEALKVFLKKQGLAPKQSKAAISTGTSKAAVSVDSHKAARKNAYENTLQFLRAKSSAQSAISVATGARVRPTESKREIAPVFLGCKGKGKSKPAASKTPEKKKEPGLYYNADTKEAYYRHADGRVSPRVNMI